MNRFRALGAALAGCLLIIAVAAPALSASPQREKHQERLGGGPGCHGLANAYAHGGAVADVAAAHGCDLTGITPVARPDRKDADDDETGDAGNGPPADVVQAKCERIAAKLATAAAREHGNSAAAFARQAGKWSCPD